MTVREFARSPSTRALALLAIYGVALAACRWAAYQLRFDFDLPAAHAWQVQAHWMWWVLMKLLLLALFGQFSELLSYFSVPDLRRLLGASLAGSGILLLIRYSAGESYAAPRGVILIDLVLSFGSLTVIRLGFRMLRERFRDNEIKERGRARRVAIFGAGDVGASLARDLMVKRGLGLDPVAFFDDDSSKWNSRVHDIPVIGAPEAILDRKQPLEIEEAIIAMPSATAKRIGELVKLLQKAHLKAATVPSLDQMATGKVRVTQLRAVEIQDLLGREPVQLDNENIRQILHGRVVMVTGAGGSIGSELCRQIASFNPQRLLMVEQSEVQMFQIEQELIEHGCGGIVLPLIADILDLPRMSQIFERLKPAVIFHAAAHKHVPMMESQPGEAIKNNTLGTVQLAELAQRNDVDRFVLISTDKAINPTNVMGATKRLAEMFLQSYYASRAGRTKFIAVRFGNVLGSSGSVIPTFKRQIESGGPVKVTHADVTRYFMTIPEAVGLVLQSGAQGNGGEIFVLDMGKPVKIVDLARELIELSGLKPDEDIEIEFTGLRPGEKLFEELSHEGENITPTTHPKIMRFVTEPPPLETVQQRLKELTRDLHNAEATQLKLSLRQAVPEYKPYLTEI